MASITNSIHDVVGALLAAEQPGFLGPDRQWQAHESNHEKQSEFLVLMELVRGFVDQLKAEELLEARASWTAADINTWFAKRGFSIEIEDQGDPDTFYIGSILEQLVHWLFPGEQRSLKGADQATYEGVWMEEGVAFYTIAGTDQVVAVLSTTNTADLAHMVMLDKPSTDPFGLLVQANAYQQLMKYDSTHEGLHFPMVSIDNQPDMSWLINLWTTSVDGRKSWISDAKQQSILKINEKGALAKSGFMGAVRMETAMLQPTIPLIIDRPFLFWMSREGYPLPLFAAWVDYSEWKNPGELK